MNYLPNKRRDSGTKERVAIVVAAIALLVVGSLFSRSLSGFLFRIFRPVIAVGSHVPPIARSVEWFRSKRSLIGENEALALELARLREELLIKDVFVNENIELKRALGRTDAEESYTLANVIARPDRTPYDTLIIDAGANLGLTVGDIVISHGATAIGRLEEVYGNTSKIKLFSAYGTQTDVLFGDDQIAVTITGHGGGNFFVELPKDVLALPGDVALLPGITPHVVGIVGHVKIGTDTSLQEAILVSPANIYELNQLFIVRNNAQDFR